MIHDGAHVQAGEVDEEDTKENEDEEEVGEHVDSINVEIGAKGKKPAPIKHPRWGLMSTHASVLVDSVGPPSAEVCRAAASFP
jgi:hypothetical protein